VEVVEDDSDEKELKALLVSITISGLNCLNRVHCYEAKVNEVQKRLENKGVKSKPNKKVKKENRSVVGSHEILDLT